MTAQQQFLAGGERPPAFTVFPSTTLRAVPLPVPGRNSGSHLFGTLGGSGWADTFLPSMGRGTSRRLVEGRRASGGPLPHTGRTGL